MRIVLLDLAAKYIHSGLAVKYLAEVVKKDFPDTVVIEETINRPDEKILSEVFRATPEVLAISCYIWNMESVWRLLPLFRTILPDTTIVLGGPEVSYTPKETFARAPEVDYILCGEGEMAFPHLLRHLTCNETLNMPGIATADQPDVGLAPVMPINDIPYPYTSYSAEDLENKLVYYESSRGCPYRCAYCLSGLGGPLRYRDLSLAKKELFDLAVNKKVKLIKFIDRTFNHNSEHAFELLSFLKDLPTETSYHLEVRADTLTEEILELFASSPPGKFQLEIGVQSTNPTTLKAIRRPSNIEKLGENVRRIRQNGNIHQHLDLIAGLPHEDLATFRRSFNEVYAWQPDMLQLGFLKLLKGSTLRDEAKLHAYQWQSHAPYEILSSRDLSFAELLELKEVEHVLEIYYNSGHFAATLPYLVKDEEPYEFYRKLATFARERGYSDVHKSLDDLFIYLLEFTGIHYPDKLNVTRELIKLDYLRHFMHRRLPDELQHIEIESYRRGAEDILNLPDVKKLLPVKLQQMSARQLLKKIHIEVFPYDMESILADRQIEEKEQLILFNYFDREQNFPGNKAETVFLPPAVKFT